MGATNSAGSTARDYNMQLVHYLRKRIVWNGPTATGIIVGTLPAGALIVPNASGAFVSTAFAGGTPQTLDIGYADDADEYASALALTTAGQIELDVETDLLVPSDRVVTATLSAGATPSAGVLDVVIAYVPDNDG